MMPSTFCQKCGAKLNVDSHFCPACGIALNPASLNLASPVTPTTSSVMPPQSEKSGLTAFLLCLFLGTLGIHRFYVGKIGTGILMFLTGGGFGLWYLYDLISIACNNFSDKEGKILLLSRDPSAAKKVVLVLGALFAGFVILISTMMAVIFMMLGNIADVAQNQLAALRAGDVEKAYAYTSVDFRKDTSLDDYKKFYEGHPIFKNNVSASFLDREFNNDEGKLKGTLKSQDGSLTPIQFILKKENGEWKIEGITLNPDSDTDHSSDVSSVKVNDGTNLLTSKALKFSINYPSDWVYQQTNPHTVEFSEKKDPSSNMLVNLQVLGSKKIGGIYTTTKDVIDDLKKQISDKGKEVKFIGEGAAKLPQSPEKVRGEYFVVTYTYDGVVLKKMQYVLMNESGDAFYTWGYTADTDHFEDSLSAAKAMYESLVMQ